MASQGLVHVVEDKEQWDSQLAEASKNGKVVVVDFSATWCGPCKVISPVFEHLSTTYKDIIFLKVDVDDVQDVAELCRISAMPTFQVWQNGKKVDELVGASKDKLTELIHKYAKEPAHAH